MQGVRLVDKKGEGRLAVQIDFVNDLDDCLFTAKIHW